MKQVFKPEVAALAAALHESNARTEGHVDAIRKRLASLRTVRPVYFKEKEEES